MTLERPERHDNDGKSNRCSANDHAQKVMADNRTMFAGLAVTQHLA